MTDVPNDDAIESPRKKRSAGASAAAAEAKATAVSDELHHLAEEASAKAAQLRKAVEERASAAKAWAGDQTEVLRDTVATRPLTSISVSAGAAFAAGLVLGVLLTSRR